MNGLTETARCYYYGIGTARSAANATAWYKKAAEHGDAESQYALGLAYEFGDGVQPDVQEALRWYRKAAGQGLAEATARIDSLTTTPR